MFRQQRNGKVGRACIEQHRQLQHAAGVKLPRGISITGRADTLFTTAEHWLWQCKHSETGETVAIECACGDETCSGFRRSWEKRFAVANVAPLAQPFERSLLVNFTHSWPATLAKHCRQARIMRVFALIAAVAAVCVVATHAASTPVIQTTHGPVQGTVETANSVAINVFHSIPFAAPPVGDLRFSRPQPPSNWADTKDVSGFPNICPQIHIIGDLFLGCVPACERVGVARF